MHTRFRSPGYTLIEVLVAMMILALSLTVLLRIFSGGLRNISIASDYSRAIVIAETQLATVDAAAVLQPGSSQGITKAGFHWTRTVGDYSPYASTDSISLPVHAYAVTVDVEWRHLHKTRRVSLHSIKLVNKRRGMH